jgi:uncharacterized delta-60 repeat protein
MFKNLRRSLLALAVVAGSSVAVKVAYAAESDGTVDLGFGASGVASFEGEFRFTLALSDGKVVAFATVDADDDYNPDKVEIRRFTSAGALDTNFGLNGTMTIEPSGHTYVQYEYSFADNAGGFYMVYSSNDPNQGPMQYDAGKMIKVTSAGVQDLNFGTGGEAVLAAPAGGQSVGGHWVDSSSGNIYTVQYGNVSALLKQAANGVPDTSFGTSNMSYIDWPYNGACQLFWRSGKMALWVDPSESYALVSAFYNDGSSRLLGVAKFDFSTRQCDTTYGTDFYSPNGSRTSDSNPDGFAEVDVIPGANSLEGSFHFQSDGSLIALVSDNSSVMKIAKVTASGSLDTTFNSSGVSPNFWSELSGGYGAFPDVFVLPNGSIRVVGHPRSGTSYAKIVALTSGGSLDSTFGTNGVAGSPVCSNIGIMNGAVRLPDGSIIADSVYGTGFPTVYRTYLVKLGAGGSASQCGTTTTQPSGGGGGFGNSCSGGASIMPSSRTEMGTVGQPMSIAAPTPSGYSTAPTFTLANNSYFPPGLNLSSNGSISGTPTSSASGMTSAITVSNGSQSCTYLITFNITGNSTPCVAGAPSSTNSAVTFDSSFSSDGVYQIMNQSDSLPAADVRPGPNGTIVVAALVGVNFGGGSSSNSSSNIYRMLPNGTLDSTWGTAGVANIDVNSSTTYGENVTSIEVLPDGSVVAAVQVYIAGPNPQQEVRLAKLTSAGVLDTGFATNGFATIHSGSGMSNVYVRDLQIAPSGSLYVIGFASGNSSSTKVYKVQANGLLDSSFATNGELTLPSQLSRVGADGSGNLYAGGQTSSNPTDARIVKYTSSGTADTAFGTNGEVVFNTSQTSSESIGAVAVANGKITAVVRVSSMGGMMTSFTESAVRVDTDGDVDASFGTAGVASLGTGSMSTQEIDFLSDGSAILSRFNMGMNPEWLMSAIGPDGSSIGTLVASPARISSGACTLSDGSVAVASSGLYVAGAQYPNGSGPVSGFVFKIALDGVSSGGGSGGGSTPVVDTPSTPATPAADTPSTPATPAADTPSTPATTAAVPTLVTSANAAALVRTPGSESIIVNGEEVVIESNTVNIPAARTPESQRTPAQVASIQQAGAALLQQFLASLPAGATSNVVVVNTATGAVMRNLVFDANGNAIDVPVEDIVFLDGPQLSLMIGSSNASITADGKYQVGAGGVVGVTGAGLGASANGEIIAMSTPTLLANFQTTAAGDFTKSATLPESIGVGDHTLVVAAGSTYALMGIRVVPGALPSTGSSTENVVIIALFTLVFGALFFRGRRTFAL